MVVPQFEVRVEEESPHGGLFEYEQKTYHRVVDVRTNEVVMTFESETTATLSTSGAGWTDYSHTGVSRVSIAPDQRSVLVQYHDGLTETIDLPA